MLVGLPNAWEKNVKSLFSLVATTMVYSSEYCVLPCPSLRQGEISNMTQTCPLCPFWWDISKKDLLRKYYLNLNIARGVGDSQREISWECSKVKNSLYTASKLGKHLVITELLGLMWLVHCKSKENMGVKTRKKCRQQEKAYSTEDYEEWLWHLCHKELLQSVNPKYDKF